MKKTIGFLLVCFCFICVPSVYAQTSGVIVRKPSEKSKKISLPKITPVPFQAPIVQEIITPSGIKAWLLEEKSTPVIAVTLVFKGGSASDPERLTGLSSLTAALLDEGAGSLDATEFQEELAERAISLSFKANADYISASLETLTDNKDQAFNLLRLSLTEPRFDRSAITRVKKQMYASIQAQKGNPNAVVADRFYKLVYQDHPYSRLSPTIEGIKAVGRGNLKKFMKDHFAKDNLVIGVSGNISADQLTDLLERTFKNLPATSRVRPVPAITPALSPRIDVLTMDIPQSATMFGHQGIARNDPDFYTALLVNHIFGNGSFSSRLFKEVREKNGLTYGVGTNLSILNASPMIVGSVASDNAKLSQSIDIIQKEWQKMAKSGPTNSELNNAKTYLTGSFALSFSSSSSLADFLAGLQYNGLPIDYFQNRNALINSVTISDAKKVAQRLWVPEQLFFVVVGKPANL